MSNIVGINGSPKIKYGASYHYLKQYTNNIINSNLYNNKDLKKIKKSNIIIFSFPLYVDSLPSHFLRFLSYLEGNNITNKNIYAICNLGFYEATQGNIALKIIKNFCLRTNNNYMGGLVIGCGPIGFKKYPIINIRIKSNLNKLKYAIAKKKVFNDKCVTTLLPRFIYLKCANYNFKKNIKKYLLKNKTII